MAVGLFDDFGLGSFLSASNQDDKDRKEEHANGLATPPGENMDAIAMLEFERKRLEELQAKLKHMIESRYVIVKKPGKIVPMFVDVVKLGAGKTFGEQALLKNNEPMLRAATIRTVKDCHLAVMSKEDFQNILKNKVKKSRLEQMEVL